VRLTTEIGAIASHNPKEPRNVLCVVRPTQFVLAQIVAVAVAVAHTESQTDGKNSRANANRAARTTGATQKVSGVIWFVFFVGEG
jgi:hypothetical protein